MGPLSLKLALFTLIGLVGVGIVGRSTPAMAANVICEGDCSQLGVPNIGEGSAFDAFALGIEATDTDRSLRVTTKGNVYLVGPVSAQNSSMLKALNIIIQAPSMVPETVRLRTRNLLDQFPSFGGRDHANGDIRTRVRERKGRVSIKSNGDLYIDISTADLMRLKIKARGSILVSGERLVPLTPVPEPSTAILMALGLVGLSLKRAASGV